MPAINGASFRWLRAVRAGWKPEASSTAPTVWSDWEVTVAVAVDEDRARGWRHEPRSIRKVVVLPAPFGRESP